MFKKILFDRELLSLRILLLLSFLGDLITLVYNRFSFSCQLLTIQNFLIPLLGVSLFLSKSEGSTRAHRLRVGIILGASMGTVIATSSTIMETIHYYFLGGRVAAFVALRQNVPPLTIANFMGETIASILFLMLLVVISSMAGFIAALFPALGGARDQIEM